MRREPDEVVATRAGDVELLRVIEEAERAGQHQCAAALSEMAKSAAFRSRTDLGITVRRRPQP